MRSRLRGLFQVDNVVPVLIVIVAVVVSLEPRIFGVEFSDRQIILTLFALLGINAVIERSGHLRKIVDRIEHIAHAVDGDMSAGRALRNRSSFERTETLIADARRSLTIIGINLQAAVDAIPSILELAKRGVVVKLLAIDPDGESLAHSARMSGVDPDHRREQIRRNLNLIRNQLETRLGAVVRRKCSLLVADRIFPVGVIGIDADMRNGSLIVQHYLTETPAQRAPLLWLRRRSEPEWFSCYLDQCDACFGDAREWSE
jgi:hypothetical protein